MRPRPRWPLGLAAALEPSHGHALSPWRSGNVGGPASDTFPGACATPAAPAAEDPVGFAHVFLRVLLDRVEVSSEDVRAVTVP